MADEEVSQAAPPELGPAITPMQWPPEGYVPGRYAPWPCSPEPVYGPDELGEMISVIDDLSASVDKCNSSGRNWETLQAWEMRLFRRGYQFLNCGFRGWGLAAASSSGAGQAQIAMQTANAMKLFPCNVFGARHKKITALLSREVPGMMITPVDETYPPDQTAAEEAQKFVEVFQQQADLKKVVTDMAGYFCTDGRVGLLTYTWADQTRWGTETPMAKQISFGVPKSEGVTPENELEPPQQDDETPTRREITQVFGKLECKVPLMADNESEMGFVRFSTEGSVGRLKAKYPWIRAKIASGGKTDNTNQLDRTARINVRLAVQSSSSGESYKNEATESVTFYEPSEYEQIADENIRNIWFETFPDGLEVWHAAGHFAFCRNARKSDHVKIAQPSPGDGQNREAILTNYLPLQKILNANISLLDRYFRSGVARRYVDSEVIDAQLINTQSNDPANITPLKLRDGQTIQQATGVEAVSSPNTAMGEFIQWLIQGGPEAMDGGSPAAFGDMETSSEDRGFVGTARLRREQALQVFSMPWAALCEAICAISQQAIESAAKNRISDINASLPGQKKLSIEIGKLQGSVLVQPESLEIPQTLAEQEEQMATLVEQSNNVALYGKIMNDPENLSVFSSFPTLSKLNIPGAADVADQQGEFEILSKSGPTPNPQYEQIQQQLQMGEGDPEAQTPQGQQLIQQLQQAVQQMPQQISTVPVAQDTSEDHAIHAAITLGFLKSPAGRKLKFGDEQQKAIYQNYFLHYKEHESMAQKLAPPREMEFKGSVSIDPSKFPPDAQTKMFQAMGLEMPPDSLTPEDQTHEVIQEKEGLDAQGIPTKTKVSVAGAPLK